MPRRRTALRIAGTFILLMLGGLIAIRTLDTAQLVRLLRTADPFVVTLAAGVYLLSWPLRGRRFDDILDAMGARCGIGYATVVIFLSQSANLLVPARAGDGLRMYFLETHREIPYTTGAASLTVERLFDLVVLLGFCGLALGWFFATRTGSVAGTATEFVVQAVLVGLFGLSVVLVIALIVRWGVGSPVALERWRDHSWIGRILQIGSEFSQNLRAIVTNPRALAVVTAGSILIWLLDVLTAVVLLHAVAGTGGVSLIELLTVCTLAVSVGNLAKVLPLTQGGIGLYEAAFTAVIVGFSPIGSAVALAVAILDHALKNVLTLVGGTGVAIALGVSPLATADRDDESPEF